MIMVLTLTVSAASLTKGAGGDANDAQSLLEALGGEKAGWINEKGEVCLRSDIELADTVNFKGGKAVINGASCIISGEGTLFSIQGGTLILGQSDNTDKEETVIFEGNGKGKGSIFDVSGGRLEIYSGALIEHGISDNGGAITVSGGELLLSGGLIRDCAANNNGGGIAVFGGKAELSGGRISSCEAGKGGGLYVSGGELALTGTVFGSETRKEETSSEIHVIAEDGNTAGFGGGICLEGGGEYGIYGIKCTANTAETGGGIYIGEGTSAAFFGGEIYYNEAHSGGGVYSSNGTVVDGAAVIAYNNAVIGGGLCLDGGEFYITGGYINSNTAQYGGGVMNYPLSVLDISGGALNYNEAAFYGGGIYNMGEVRISNGSTGYNKIKNPDESYIGWGADILNYGKLTLSNEVFFGGDGDIAVVNTVEEHNAAKYENNAIILEGPFTCTTTISRIVPVSVSGQDFIPAYEKGTALLVTSDEKGENSGMKYYAGLFGVPDDSTGGAWVVGSDGNLRTAPFGIWVWIAIAGAAVIVAAGIAYTVKSRRSR